MSLLPKRHKTHWQSGMEECLTCFANLKDRSVWNLMVSSLVLQSASWCLAVHSAFVVPAEPIPALVFSSY